MIVYDIVGMPTDQRLQHSRVWSHPGVSFRTKYRQLGASLVDRCLSHEILVDYFTSERNCFSTSLALIDTFNGVCPKRAATVPTALPSAGASSPGYCYAANPE